DAPGHAVSGHAQGQQFPDARLERAVELPVAGPGHRDQGGPVMIYLLRAVTDLAVARERVVVLDQVAEPQPQLREVQRSSPVVVHHLPSLRTVTFSLGRYSL